MENRKALHKGPRCGDCHWYSQGWCGCLFGQNDKDQRNHYDEGCEDWTPKDAKSGVLASGMMWSQIS